MFVECICNGFVVIECFVIKGDSAVFCVSWFFVRKIIDCLPEYVYVCLMVEVFVKFFFP